MEILNKITSVPNWDPVYQASLALWICITIFYGVLSWPFALFIALPICFKMYFKLTLGMNWSTRRIDGKVAIVTGANSGIGFETSKELAKRGGKIIMACRNIERGEQAAGEIRKDVPNANVSVMKLDLASLTSVREFSKKILEEETGLDILINNAGGITMQKVLTEDNLESNIAGNHFGPFLLTNLLLGLMKKTGNARIIIVSSQNHYLSLQMDLENLNSEKFFQTDAVYAKSKLANILFTRELDRRLRVAGITGIAVNALCPGLVKTTIFSYTKEVWYRHILNRMLELIMKTPCEGAQTQIHLAVAEEVEGLSERYWTECAECNSSPISKNNKLAKELWEKCVQTVSLTQEETIF